ncbi:MAG: thymidylate synthase [Candidatus Woesearchaeota archaeon]|jgi:thymidylate synthase
MELINDDVMALWKNALTLVIKQGEEFKDNDGRICLEENNLVLTLTESTPKISEPIERMIERKKWIYPSKDELSNIMFKEYQAPTYDYTYGRRIFSFGDTLDQINSFIIPLLKEDSSSRRAVIVLYDPIEDSNITNKNSPGIIYIQFRIKQNKLCLNCHIRSNDLFFGWPANIYQIYTLQKFIAEKLKIERGNISTISNSAHVFKDDLEEINKIIG